MRRARCTPKHSVKVSHCASVHIAYPPGCPTRSLQASDPTPGWVLAYPNRSLAAPRPVAAKGGDGRSAPVGDEKRVLLAETLDRDPHRVARFEEFRRLEAHRDPGRGAGRDDVARDQRHEMADIADDVLDAEDQVGGVAVLPPLAVDFGRDLELAGIAHLVAGDEPRSERAERVAA